MNRKATRVILSAVFLCSSFGAAPVSGEEARKPNERRLEDRAAASTAPILLGIGDSIGQSVQSADASLRTQSVGFMNVVAKQAGLPFPLPVIIGGALTTVRSTANRSRLTPFLAASNISVSGTDVNGILNDRADAFIEAQIDSETDLVIFPRRGSQIEIAEALAPPFIVSHFGSNDVLSAALSFDQLDGSQVTPVEEFRSSFTEIVQRLDAVGSQVVYANIPDVTAIAFLLDRQELSEMLGSDFGLPQGSFTTLVAAFLIQLGLDDGSILQDPNFVLDAAETALLQDRVAVFNQIIAEETAKVGMPVVDINGLFDFFSQNPPQIGNIELSTAYLGGVFSLDGVHPSNITQLLLADVFIAVMNASFGTGIPRISDFQYLATFLSDPFIDKDGDGVVTGRPLAGLLETLGPFLGVSGDPDDANPGISAAIRPRGELLLVDRETTIATFKRILGNR